VQSGVDSPLSSRGAPREPVTHRLKTWPEPFQALWDGRKHHEIRRADRDFRQGDWLELREWDPGTETYTGRIAHARVTYLSMAGTWGLPADLLVMSVVVIALTSGRPPQDVTRQDGLTGEAVMVADGLVPAPRLKTSSPIAAGAIHIGQPDTHDELLCLVEVPYIVGVEPEEGVELQVRVGPEPEEGVRLDVLVGEEPEQGIGFDVCVESAGGGA